jgi:sporulation protein YlmC with PRC-barrel domain
MSAPALLPSFVELLSAGEPLLPSSLMEETMKIIATHMLAASVLLASAAALPAFATDNMQTADEYRTSQLVGSKVYNNANENIGSIEDIVLKPDGSLDEVVLSVGGFLGIGDKYVSVPFTALKVSRDGSSLKVMTDGTKDSLKALPDYKFFKS